MKFFVHTEKTELYISLRLTFLTMKAIKRLLLNVKTVKISVNQ